MNSRTSTYKTIGFSKKFILSGFTISDAYPIKFPNGKVYNFWYLRYDFLKIQMPPPKFKNNVGKKRIRARLWFKIQIKINKKLYNYKNLSYKIENE